MIIGLIDIPKTTNHDLSPLVDENSLMENLPLFTQHRQIDHMIEFVGSICNQTMWIGDINTIHSRRVENYSWQSSNGSSSSSSFFCAQKYPDHPIVYIPSNIICSDWDQLRSEINSAVLKCMNQDLPVIISTSSIYADPTRSSMKNKHFSSTPTAEQMGRSDILYNKAVSRTNYLSNKKYTPYSGICVFKARQVFEMLESCMPRYTSWINEKQWDKVDQISFEQSVLENLLNYNVIESKTTISPVNHFYQIVNYLFTLNGYDMPPRIWSVWLDTPHYEYAVRTVTSVDEKIDLIPAIYYPHDSRILTPWETTTTEYKTFNSIDTTILRVRAK